MNSDRFATDLMIATILLGLFANALAVAVSVPGFVQAQTLIPVQSAIVQADGNGFGSSLSDSQGRYNISSFLDTGNYTVTASAQGYLDSEKDNVPVTAGAETANTDFVLTVSGAISGNVTDAGSGQPLPNVLVTAYNATGTSQSGQTVPTDTSGNYLINTNLPTGTYNVTASSASGHLSKTVTGISVTQGTATDPVNLALALSGTIAGTVTDSVSHSALKNVVIQAIDQNGNFTAQAITDNNGNYNMNNSLPTGTYNVTAVFPTGHIPKTIAGVVVTAGSQTTQNITLDPSGIISGRVTSTITGQPVSGASVYASFGSFFGIATTNATGYYRITDGLATETYMIIASYGVAFNQLTGVSVVQGSETVNQNIQLAIPASGTITGLVTNSTGSPIPYATVTAAQGLVVLGSATADINGNYTINGGLTTGTYNVTASSNGFFSSMQSPISVTVDQVTVVNFQLQTIASGRISGLVEAQGIPIPEYNTSTYAPIIFAAAVAVVVLSKTRKNRKQELERQPQLLKA